MTINTPIWAYLLISSQPMETRLKIFVDYTEDVREHLDRG